MNDLKPFEPTRQFARDIARDYVTPRVVEIAKQHDDHPFYLREIHKNVLAKILTPEQLATRCTNNNTKQPMEGSIWWYVRRAARDAYGLKPLGERNDNDDELFRNPTPAEEQAEDAQVEAEEQQADDPNKPGTIYAYSFPLITKTEGRFPIKIGKANGDAEARIEQQTTSCFEYPVTLKTWKVQRVSAVERAIHAILKARGQKRDAPGTEWFDTTIEEIETIIEFILKDAGQ